MVATPPSPVTTSQDGIFGDREYVVACKERPFTILMPTSLPTPPSPMWITSKNTFHKTHKTYDLCILKVYIRRVMIFFFQ